MGQAENTAPEERNCARWTAWFVAGGVALRLLLYGLAFPLWGDETFLAANFIEGDWGSLAGPLIAQQVAPLFFLQGEFAAYRLLGPSEWAVRLLPALAGIAALVWFWRLARRELSPRAALFAVAILAVADEPVRLAALLKPYSIDLLLAVAFTDLALRWRRRPERLAPLVALAALGAVAPWCSYPAAFAAGGVGLALAPTAFRARRSAAWLAAFGTLSLASFAAHYHWVGKAQVDGDGGRGRRGLNEYWRRGFPPARAAEWPLWLLQAHVGQTWAYPIGDRNGGSALTAAFAGAGALALWQARRRTMTVALAAPFALNFAAACIGKYPYGEGVRLAQHLAPAICLWAGAGMARQAEAFSPKWRTIAKNAALLALAAFAVGQAVRFVARPFRDEDAQWTRAFARQLALHVRPGDQVATPVGREFGGPLLWWHAAANGVAIRWEDRIDWRALEETNGRLWWLDCRNGVEAEPRPDAAAARLLGHPGWTLHPPVCLYLPGEPQWPDDCRRLDVFLATRPGAAPPAPWTTWPGR